MDGSRRDRTVAKSYQQYGDVRILEQHYASMVAYMDYLERRAVRYVQPFGGFGDWLAIDRRIPC